MNFVGFDLETASRDPEHPEYALMPWTVKTKGAQITLSCAYFMGNSRVEAHLLPTTLRDLRALNKPVALWNGIFDLAFLYASDISIRGIHWIDAMNLWKFLDNGQDMPMSWSLKAGAKKFLKDWPKLKDFLELKDEELPDPSDPYWRERVIMDAEATALIAETIWPQLTPQQQNLAKIQSVSLPMMAKSWVNGIRIDIDAVYKARPEIIQKMVLQEMKLGLLEPGSTAENYTPSKVLRSPVKLRKLIYEDYGLPCTRYIDGGVSGNQQKSTDKAALTYLADVDDRVQEILIWRKYNTILSKFINTPIEACDYLQSDVTHAAPRVFATYTGRGSFSSKVGKKKVGVALHQLPRGKEVRAYILATFPRHYVVEFDVMAQEARWMAIMANDPVMQQLFNSEAPFNDIHSYMGSQILGLSFEEFLQRKAAHDPKILGAHGGRNLGKFCIAEGQLVDTDSGPIFIEQVSLDNKVWDGVEFVQHKGVVCKGLKTVITRDGVTGTPDHRVLCEDKTWRQLQEVSNGSIKRAYPPEERAEIRKVGNHIRHKPQKKRNYLPRRSLRVWEGAVSSLCKFRTRFIYAVQALLPALPKNKLSSLQGVSASVSCSERSMQEPKKPLLQRLWRERDRDEVFEPSGVGGLHHRAHTKKELQGTPDRSSKQQRSLRTGEFAGCQSKKEFTQQRWFEGCFVQRSGGLCLRLVASVKIGLSKLLLLSVKYYELITKRTVNRRNFRAGQVEEIQRKKKICYDILDAGPRNRFTIQGRVVSNCNLSFNYRISPAAARVKAKVDYSLDTSLQQTFDWKTKFTQAYQGIPRYWDQAPKIAQAKGFSETAAGRRYKLSHWQDMHWATSSSAINQPIQGSSADQKELALAVLVTQMPDLEDRLMFEMHDAVHLSIPGGYSMRFLQKANKILDDIDYERYWGYKPPVSFPWEGSLGPNEGSKIEFGYDADPNMTIDEFYKENKE